jgi:ketosteroid isomerase-like protein
VELPVLDSNPLAGDNRAMEQERVNAVSSIAAVRGRCVRGRDELKVDFLRGFEAFAIEQDVSSVEIIIRGAWAFEIGEVESRLIPNCGGEPTNVQSTTVVALNRQPDGSWKVGRVLGLS